jgi:hypothetical protein
MDMKMKSSDELVARQKLLESEILSNEQEISEWQKELNAIYAEQDKRRAEG